MEADSKAFCCWSTVQSVLLLLAGLVSASEPSFSEYVRRFAGDVAAGDNSVTDMEQSGCGVDQSRQ